MQAPTIYYYFESRESLIEEVIYTGTVKLREFVKAALDAAPADATPLEHLDLAIEAHLRLLMSESGFAHAHIRNLGQLPDSMRARQLPEERKYAALWRAIFKAAQADGSVRPELNLEFAQNLIIGQLNGATEWWTPKRGSLEALIATAQGIARSGITVG
jgi:AcrR family transcriptional regulator